MVTVQRSTPAQRETLAPVLSALAPIIGPDARRFVLWRPEPVAGKSKPAKMPRQPSGRPASPTNPATWSTAIRCLEALPRIGAVGLGVTLTADDRLTCIDLDRCVAVDGSLSDHARSLLARFPSYTERSPSGDGLHIWVLADWPTGADRRIPRSETELYSIGGYITLTGDHWPGSPTEILEATEAVAELIRELCPRVDATPVASVASVTISAQITDAHALRRLLALPDAAVLWRGDPSAADGDASRADYRLCRAAALILGDDPARIDALVSAAPLMARTKWQDRPDYRARTIRRAIHDQRGTVRDRPAASPVASVVIPDRPDRQTTQPRTEPVIFDRAAAGELVSLEDYRRVCEERDHERAQRLDAENRARQLEAERDRERFLRVQADQRHRDRDRLEEDRQRVLRNRALPGADVMIATIAELAEKDRKTGDAGQWHVFPQSFATKTTGKSRKTVSDAHKLLAAIGATNRHLRLIPGQDHKTTHLQLRMTETEALALLASYSPAPDETGAVPNQHGGKRTPARVVPITLPSCPDCGPDASLELTIACIDCGAVLDRQKIDPPSAETEPTTTDQPDPMYQDETLLEGQHRGGTRNDENAMFQDETWPPPPVLACREAS